MKKHFFLLSALAAATGLMTSCSTDEELTGGNTIDPKAISFATSQPAQTRSASTLTALDKFTVSAVNDDKTSFFSGVEYNYNTAAGVFASTVPNYWPTTGNLSFYAINETGEASTDAVPTYTYTDWAGETDLVAATVIAGEKTIPYPLTFQHVTSQIRVSAEASDTTEVLTYKLTGVKMTTPSKGVYTFATTTGGIGQWQIDNDSTKEYSFEDALPLSFSQTGSVNTNDIYWNILPVTNGEINFTIEYQVIQNGKVIADFTGAKAKTCKVSSPNLASGKRYVYNFLLSRGTEDEITFTMTMTDWNDGDTSDYDIPQLPIALYTYVDASGEERVVEYLTEKNVTWSMVEGKTSAYDENTTLKSVYLSDKVETLAKQSFFNCTALTDIRLPKGLKSLPGYVHWNTTYPSINTYQRLGMFVDCRNLKNVVLPDSLQEIGDLCFKSCSSLTEMHIPESVTTFGQGVFWYCSNLKKVTLPSSLKSIPTATFADCRALEEVNIPNGVTSISGSAFMYCKSLKSLHLPEGVTYIGPYAFSACSELSDMNIPSTVTTLRERALQGTALKSITIPKRLTTIDDYALINIYFETITVDAENKTYDSRDNCNCLIQTSTNKLLCGSKNSVIPDGIKTIANSAFYYVSSEEMVVPASVETIERTAFGADDTKRLTINGTPYLEAYSICCDNLETLDLPVSFTFKSEAIRNCNSLKDVNYAGTKKQWNSLITNCMRWNNPATFTVHCTDGDLLYENVTYCGDNYTQL